MSFISKYADAIQKNLPEWNHQAAHNSQKIKDEISSFQEACAQIDTTQQIDSQLKELATVIEQHVPDNHISIYKGNRPLRTISITHPKENLATNISHIQGVSSVVEIPMQADNCWCVATLKDKKTGVVAIPSFSGHIEKQKEQRRKFVETFFEEKEKNNWQHIIFDFRGNTGGDSEIIKEIAERMSEEEVKYADKTELVNTPAAHKKISEGYILETETHYKPISKTDKFTGSICILQDQYNASATEGAIFMLSQLPNTKTIGEKTAGCFAGGATTRLEMGDNTSLSIGTVYRERFDKKGSPIREKVGMEPDIPCNYNQAFEIALTQISKNVITSQMLLNKRER